MMAGGALMYALFFIFFTENAMGDYFRKLSTACSNAMSRKKPPMLVADTAGTLGNVAGEGSETIGEDQRNIILLSKSTQGQALAAAEQKKAKKKKDNELSEDEERLFHSLDTDVIREKEKIAKLVERGIINRQQSAIFIHNLRKIYYARGSTPAKVAVKNINLSIPQGEIFGLLGANGAGKTTLLKMVSGLEEPSSGFALINGFDVVRNTNQAQRSMGLCPQFDTLVERLTVRENLLFFGQIKGLSKTSLVSVCEAFMKAIGIKRYENKLIQHLSGGNRRKVSLAVALLGAPPTVYLDEPSTGLDPVACRLMWRLLSKIATAKTTAMVLTTHNMLECEAVCTRVGIMKLGEMVCLGDSQHLRSTHGTGFLLELNLIRSESEEAVKQVKNQLCVFYFLVFFTLFSY
jgi:ABC-type multidrug transport system ATPase subunit